jgi:hypothetical protein
MAALLLPLDTTADKPKKLMDQVRDVLRLKHYNYGTEPRKRLRLTRFAELHAKRCFMSIWAGEWRKEKVFMVGGRSASRCARGDGAL